ncbi:plasmid mobilization protein [Sinomicrobium oceani]|uniref:plasmid mobilization protein n=1 Tax=Sinomicrobium oceani TaxID=1150368 RepID=UPI00227C7ED8|nr:plasmid mobilization relaxosome protein MobC [Sinomicrobium oceani]
MMKKEKTSRTRMVQFRLTPEEYQKLQKRFNGTTHKKLSQYLRDCLLKKPIVATYRNASLDDFMEEVSLLRKELNYIGVNHNQVVKKLHTLQRIEGFKIWIETYEKDKILLWNKIEAIGNHLQKIAVQWLQ